jgi:hypothetical protein
MWFGCFSWWNSFHQSFCLFSDIWHSSHYRIKLADNMKLVSYYTEAEILVLRTMYGCFPYQYKKTISSLKKQSFFNLNIPQKILPYFSSGFYFFWFRNSNIFTEQCRRQLASAPNMEDQVFVFIFLSDRLTQLSFQAPGFLSVKF